MNDIKTPEELLNFMSNNIEYGFLGKNGHIYRYDDPDFDSDWYEQCILENKEDILKNKHGTCWDQVEFEREWFLNNNYEIKTIYEMVNVDYENNYPTHTFLAYKDKDNWYWFEHSDFNNRGIHKFDTFDNLISYQLNKYIEFLKTFGITNDEIDKIIITEFDKPKEHISTEEYFNHVLNSKIIKEVK